jgi:hypothetical protein
MGTTNLLWTDIRDATVDNESFVRSAFDTDTPSIDETRFTALQSAEGQSVTSVDGIKAEQFPMYLNEVLRWTKILRTGGDERTIAKLVEVFVAISGVVICDDDLAISVQTQPARIEPPVTASAQ